MNYILAIIILVLLIYTVIKVLKSRKPLPKDKWGYTSDEYDSFEKKVTSREAKQAFKELRDSAKKLDHE